MFIDYYSMYGECMIFGCVQRVWIRQMVGSSEGADYEGNSVSRGMCFVHPKLDSVALVRLICNQP